jgi:hypothetical protein
MLKNLTHKMSVLTAKAGRSIKHKVNAMRNHVYNNLKKKKKKS